MIHSLHSKLSHTLKPIAVIVLVFLILTAFRLLWLSYHFPPDQPFAERGILDLRGYELKEDQTITLNGEWEFIPGTFAEPHLVEPNFEEEGVFPSSIQWISVPTSNSAALPYQFGTYRLRILLNHDEDQTYGLRLATAKTASKLFINGNLLAQSGEVGEKRGEHRGEDIPYTVYFPVHDNEIQILLHVSNFDTAENVGIAKSIKFGIGKAILAEQEFQKTAIIFIIVVLLMYSLYTILVYLFVYRDKRLLLLAIGFLLPAMDELITYNKAVLTWLPLNYDWSVKLINLVYLGAALFFIQLMRTLLTKNNVTPIFRWYAIMYGLSAISIILLPITYLSRANLLFFGLYFISFLTVLVFTLREYFQNQAESFFLAFTAVSTTSGIIWGIIKGVAMIEIPFYPFDYLFAFLGFAAFWFKRFSLTRKQVNDLVEDLKKTNIEKDDFLETSAQKLWSPLNEMITIAQIIHDSEKTSLSEHHRNNLKLLINIERSMAFVLNDLVDFTRLKEGTIHLQPKSMNVQAAVTSLFDILRFLTDGKATEFVSKVPDLFPNVLADEKRLIQVLFNLLHTSIKYLNANLIVVEAEDHDGMATISIKVSGHDTDEETQQRILCAYEQGDGHTTNDDGLEVSLNVSRQLIQLHGGILQIHVLPQQGIEFIFTLPLAGEAVSEVDKLEELEEQIELEEQAERGGILNKAALYQLVTNPTELRERDYTILVVGDDPVQLKVISKLFLLESYEVVTVTSGEEALAYLDIMDWDLLIIDAIMPKMSGYELTSRIRKRYSKLELPILLLTARNNPEDVYPGFAMGINDYVTKPINSLELKSRGKALIDLKHSITEQLHMEAAWLQAQIQPHFLFNTLNTIASLSAIDTSRMVTLLDKFGNYLRGSFDVKNLQRLVPLEHELELVRSYLYIEQERFGERLQVHWEIEDDLVLEIPPLTIQPLVENAVRHGVLKRPSGGTIWISITTQADGTRIAIKDDGVGMDEEKVQKVLHEKNMSERGIGILNTNRRLKRIYGQGLQIISSPNQGTTIMFMIPK
ncbi:ATP-binding protein [Rubeoparvulum massiliense]|uniref:ATP-binding protein n=1 Tax=Rubeoparvulum massiliense TaxID=1631346 RepID=UPI00065E26CE|nr:ATP-binding protein [Rubeoparvulum massiliense]